jgi:hypothetical protein
MMESSLPLHVPPKTSTIRFRRTPEERNGRRVWTRFDPASILKLGTYAYSIRKDEIITQPRTRHCGHKETLDNTTSRTTRPTRWPRKCAVHLPSSGPKRVNVWSPGSREKRSASSLPTPTACKVPEDCRELKKLVDDIVGARYISRVTASFQLTTQDGFPAIEINTMARIHRPEAQVFHVIAANPNTFWLWMMDRNRPGGLSIWGCWPEVGSYYTYRFRPKLPMTRLFFKPLLSKWEQGCVDVVDMIANRLLVTDEVLGSSDCGNCCSTIKVCAGALSANCCRAMT